MMEIPSGKYCLLDGVSKYGNYDKAASCPFFRFHSSDWAGDWNECMNPEFEEERVPKSDLDGYMERGMPCNFAPLRSGGCLSAYPSGAVVTITPKEDDNGK